MDVRERLIQILSVPIYPHLDADPAEAVADYLLDHGVTITPAVPGPVVGHDITELCFLNGKEEGRKELKAEVLAHLLDQKTKVKGLCHAHVVEMMKFVEGL